MKIKLMFDVSSGFCILDDIPGDSIKLVADYNGCLEGVHNALDKLMCDISLSDIPRRHIITLSLDMVRDLNPKTHQAKIKRYK